MVCCAARCGLDDDIPNVRVILPADNDSFSPNVPFPPGVCLGSDGEATATSVAGIESSLNEGGVNCFISAFLAHIPFASGERYFNVVLDGVSAPPHGYPKFPLVLVCYDSPPEMCGGAGPANPPPSPKRRRRKRRKPKNPLQFCLSCGQYVRVKRPKKLNVYAPVYCPLADPDVAVFGERVASPIPMMDHFVDLEAGQFEESC